MVTEQFVLHGLNTPSGFLSQLSQLSSNTNIQVQRGAPAGLPGSRFIYNGGQNPDITFSCEQLKTLLDMTGAGLADISSGNTDLYFKHVPNRGQRSSDASTVHIRARAAKAVLLPISLTASVGGNASCAARLICTYDGTNEPLVPATGVALAGTPVSAEEQFTVGPCSLNVGSGAVAISGVQEVTIEFGVALYEMTADGELYVTLVAERDRNPVVTIKTLTALLPSIGLNGKVLTEMKVWLRKCGAVARVANGTAEHLLFTGTAGLVHVPTAEGGGNNPHITTIRCELAMPNATTQPLTVSTTSTIS